MTAWIGSGNTSWTDPTRWAGGAIPNGAGAVATFDSAGIASDNSALITLPNGGTITLGRLEVFVQTLSFAFQTPLAPAQSTLRMQSAFGEPAIIDVDSNASPRVVSILSSPDRLLTLNLASDTNVITRNSDTQLDLRCPITGTGQLAKYGDGVLKLVGTSTFSGGLRLEGGTLDLFSGDSSLGSGAITFHGGTLLCGTTTIDNAIFVPLGGGADGTILARAGTTLTLASGSFLNVGGAGSVLALGSSLHNGSIVLRFGEVTILPGSGFALNGGTVRFGDAFNAANALYATGAGLVELRTGATLDTGGFAARIGNLDFDGGTLTSGSGALNARIDYVTTQVNTGTVAGTAQADSVTFALVAPVLLVLAGVTFSNWTDGADRVHIIGSTGDDSVTGSAQADSIVGGAGIDQLSGGLGNDTLDGGFGNDSLLGEGGNDSLLGAGASDSLTGGDGNDTMNGGLGADSLDGGLGNDSLNGAGGADGIIGGAGNDTLRGGLGGDALVGEDDADSLIGDAGDDTLFGGAGNDTLNGGNDFDVLAGSSGDDVLTGSLEADTMSGGLGADRFTWNVNDFGSDLRIIVDQITDFSQAEGDRIDLSVIDASTTAPANNAFTFIGNAAFGAVGGQLRFVAEGGNTFVEGDRNGDGVADFAIRLDGLITLTAADFVL